MKTEPSILRILLIESSNHDILAFRSGMQASGIAHQITALQAEEALKCLQTDIGDFDVMVVSHRLQQMSGLTLFKTLSAIKIPIPIIYLAETGSEKVVVEALEAGVDDYVIKDPGQRYLDLLPAVLLKVRQNHLDRSAERRAAADLEKACLLKEQALQFIESMLTAIPTPIFYKDTEGRYLGCNHAFSEIMGVSSEEMRGRTVFEVWPEEQARVYHEKDQELFMSPVRQAYEFMIRDKEGNPHSVIYAKDVFRDGNDQVLGIVGVFTDISKRKEAEEAREITVRELQEALSKVKQLSGLLPICAHCKKIRDDKGYWNQLELYIRKHSEAKFSHGLCPECASLLYPDFFQTE